MGIYSKTLFFRLKFQLFETVVKDLEEIRNGCIEAKADAGNRHWDKIAAGVEITAGTEQTEA